MKKLGLLKNRTWSLGGILLLALLIPVFIASAQDSLVQRYFRDLQSLQADFVQLVYDEQFRLIQSSSGHMRMQRPGRFRWDYEEPYPQVIVADGERLWHYDQDLEQVTVRRLEAVLGGTPLALLSGAAPIEDAFKVNAVVERDGLQWYELQPRDEQSEFQVLRIGFDGETLSAIELEDALNQLTRLHFEHLERNVDIDPRQFQFVPPPGVDVVGDVS